MTDIPEITNITPNTGIYRELPENMETHEISPPSASEPVSPINMDALFVLNIRNAPKAPQAMKQIYAKPSFLSDSITAKTNK